MCVAVLCVHVSIPRPKAKSSKTVKKKKKKKKKRKASALSFDPTEIGGDDGELAYLDNVKVGKDPSVATDFLPDAERWVEPASVIKFLII